MGSTVKALKPNEEEKIVPMIPCWFPELDYFSSSSYKAWIVIIVDAKNQVDESDENNVFVSKDPITVYKNSGNQEAKGLSDSNNFMKKSSISRSEIQNSLLINIYKWFMQT